MLNLLIFFFSDDETRKIHATELIIGVTVILLLCWIISFNSGEMECNMLKIEHLLTNKSAGASRSSCNML